MGIINVLDISVANLIAAGEVVERPASVVKELVENSIDAGAKNITVEIKNGGVSLIRVSDDGCGMSKEDLPVCVLRHATSKISGKQDLNMIKTLGFRGEALAAIASVSRLRIITKMKNAQGYVLESLGGKVADISETGCADGTTVIVEELFGNVPARRKFLKKDSTECAAVMAVCEKVALSNPDISVSFISDNNLRFRTVADGSLKNAIHSVFGREFAKNMISVEGSADGIDVDGFIGTPQNCRVNRNMQIFFVNGRYVKNKSIQAALESAVTSYVPHEKFPTAVLNVTLHPGFVDVNVHPAKTEIKFSNEKAVFDAVYCIVKNAVDKSTKRPTLDISDVTKAPPVRFTPIEDGKVESLKKRQISFDEITKEIPKEKTPSVPFENTISKENTEIKSLKNPSFSFFETKKVPPEPLAAQPVYEIKTETKEPFVPQSTAAVKETKEPFIPQSVYELKKETISQPIYEIKKEEPKEEIKQTEEYKPTKLPGQYTLRGEIFNTYLIVECENEAYIIDKHAAHERIIFEELKPGVGKKAGYSQILMIPLEIPISDEEMAAAEEYKEEITASGFSYTCTDGMATVTEIPSNLTEGAALDLFITVLSSLAEGAGNATLARDTVYEKALYQSSCKAAIKAGELNTQEELKALVDRLMACPEITHCPHGRPVAFIMTKSSVERRFGRI